MPLLRIPPSLHSPAQNPESKPSSTTRTIATRVPNSEADAIDAAAKAAGKTCAVWLREAALAHLNRSVRGKKSSPDPTLLAEVLALRSLTVNLFSALAGDLPKETIQKIVAHADTTKQGKADEILRRLEDPN